MKILSVIIPVYNQEELVKRAIGSVPVRDDLEIIVIDDASTDDTINSVLSMNRSDLTLITVSKRKSIGYCRNLGLNASKGQFIF